MQQILMIRCPMEVVDRGYIGCGWPKINFSQYSDVVQLLKDMPNESRRRKNIQRFFDLKQGDIVLVPISGAVCVGMVQGEKSFNAEFAEIDACNLIKVEFLKSGNRVLGIPRRELGHRLESRLKIRTAIADLIDFKEEILRIYEAAKSGGAYKHSNYFDEQAEIAAEKFKVELLEALRKGKTWLRAGGIGLENLIKELLEIEGFKADIQPKKRKKRKNQPSDIADIDIKASRTDKFSAITLLVQVKHHNGVTGGHGLRQLKAYPVSEDGDSQKWLITTGEVGSEKIEAEENNGIKIMQGKELAEWIYEHWQELAVKTKQELGIVEVPMLLGRGL